MKFEGEVALHVAASSFRQAGRRAGELATPRRVGGYAKCDSEDSHATH